MVAASFYGIEAVPIGSDGSDAQTLAIWGEGLTVHRGLLSIQPKTRKFLSLLHLHGLRDRRRARRGHSPSG
jgi:hypothetical protein